MPIFYFNAQSVKEKMYHNQIDNFGYRVCRKCYRKFAADEKGYAEGLGLHVCPIKDAVTEEHKTGDERGVSKEKAGIMVDEETLKAMIVDIVKEVLADSKHVM
jgi:hypothetical protein